MKDMLRYSRSEIGITWHQLRCSEVLILHTMCGESFPRDGAEHRARPKRGDRCKTCDRVSRVAEALGAEDVPRCLDFELALAAVNARITGLGGSYNGAGYPKKKPRPKR